MNEKAFLRMTQNEEIFRRSIRLLQQKETPWKQAAVSGLQYGYVMNMAILQEVPPSQRREAKKVFRYWKEALTPTADPWVRRFSAALNLCGVGAMSRILQRMKRIKRSR